MVKKPYHNVAYSKCPKHEILILDVNRLNSSLRVSCS